MTRLTYLPLLLLLPLLLFACANPQLECKDALGCVVLGPNEPIRIATLLALSGEAASLGLDALGGVEIALADRGSQLLNHPLQLANEDGGCTAESAQTAVQTLTADPTIVAIIGPTCSSAAVAAIPTIHQTGYTMISPSATALELDIPLTLGGNWQAGFYRTIPNPLLQAQRAAEFAYQQLGAQKAAVVHDGSLYTSGLQRTFVTTFRNLGGTVTYQGSFRVGDEDINDILLGVNTGSPDVLYLPLFEPEAVFLVNQLLGVPTPPAITLIGANSLFVPSFASSAGLAAEDMYVVGTAVSSPAYDTFLTKWQTRYGGLPTAQYHAYAYDATNLLLNAIESVAQVENNNILLIGRAALRDAIAQTSGLDGLAGTLHCTQWGDCASDSSIGVYRLSLNQINTNVWPPDLVGN